MVLSQMPPLLLSAILVTLAIPATADTSLHVALAPASLQDSDAMASSLHKQGLSSLLEVQLLHVEEAQEMWASLREDAISLGDRAKLRRTACDQSEQRVHGGLQCKEDRRCLRCRVQGGLCKPCRVLL